jgi:hypothetical protein
MIFFYYVRNKTPNFSVHIPSIGSITKSLSEIQ